eukprot:TRINITY_DN11404_c0_g1_i1.p1 TRINITY_DN11404_c0_g1~~TRINITY_DN11404_c0_g1_i1.p1  ORF type:complete len:432 (+),score=114.06 TRINITY_DN11404_c0_g1_i1:149-1444(+)
MVSIRQGATYLSFAVIALLIASSLKTRVAIPSHLLGNSATFKSDLLSPKQGDELLTLLKSMKDFPTNSNDVRFYKAEREHVGEAVPLVGGKCDHPYMVPNTNRTHCVLPGRIDVGRHFILGGGVVGIKAPYNELVSRVLSFGRYMFNLTDYPVAAKLFRDPKFIALAKEVCPADKQYLDPFQFNFIMQIPGQTVALHIDAPYFWGATRFQFPQWLLAAMVFSNLFQDKFVDQVQVVAYLHRWQKDQVKKRAGSFVYWNTQDQKTKHIWPEPLGGSAVDGSKTVHAAGIYRPDIQPPIMDRSADNVLSYKGDGKWVLTSNGKHLRDYTDDDLRMTIVYRAKCFKDAAEAKRYNNLPAKENMSLEYIMDTLKADLVKRGRLSKGQEISTIDLSILIMDEYIRYPLSPSAVIPWNYCALPRLYPWTESFLKYVC